MRERNELREYRVRNPVTAVYLDIAEVEYRSMRDKPLRPVPFVHPARGKRD